MIRLLLIAIATLSAAYAGAAVEGTTAHVFVEVRGVLYNGITPAGEDVGRAIVRAEGVDWELDYEGDRKLYSSVQEFCGIEVRASGSLEIVGAPSGQLRHIIHVTGLKPSVVPYTVAYTTSKWEEEPFESAVEMPAGDLPVPWSVGDSGVYENQPRNHIYEPRGAIPDRVIERPLDWWEPSDVLDMPFRGPEHESILPHIRINW